MRTIIVVFLTWVLVACGGSSSVDDAVQDIAKDLDLSALFKDHAKTNTKVTFDGTQANCPSNAQASYVWTLQAPSGSSATLDDQTSPQPSVTLDVAGEYTADVEVSCAEGGAHGAASGNVVKVIKESYSVIATDGHVNAEAVAVAPPAQSGKVGVQSVLDGSKSYDNDAHPLTYSWVILTAPSGSTASLNDDTAAQPTFIPDAAGQYQFSLTVHDGNVDSLAGSTTLYVAGVGTNGQPIADAGRDQTDQSGHEVTLHGLGSHDIDADTLTYEWELNSEPTGSNLSSILGNSGFVATSAEPKFTPTTPGYYVFRLRVNDGALTSVWEYVTIHVKSNVPGNSPLNSLIAMGLDSSDAHHLLDNHASDVTSVTAISDPIFSGVTITDDMFKPPTDSGAAGFTDPQMTNWGARHIKRFKKIFGRIAFVLNTDRFKNAFDAQVGLLNAAYQGTNNLVLPANIAAFKADPSATITFPGSFSDYKSAVNSVVDDVFGDGGKFRFYLSDRRSGVAYGGRVLKLKVERMGMAGDASPDGQTKPWAINQAAALMFHELMHSVGYAHDGTNDEVVLKPNNIPYFVQIIAGYQETDILGVYCGGAVATCTKTYYQGAPNALYTHYFGDN